MPDGGDEDVGNALGDEGLASRVEITLAKLKASRGTHWKLCSKRRSRGDRQDGPRPWPSSFAQERRVAWLVRQHHQVQYHQETAPRSMHCRFLIVSGTSLAQGCLRCRGVLDAPAGLAIVHPACALLVTAARRVTARTVGSAGVMVAAALRHGRPVEVLAIGASSCARIVCSFSTTAALFQAGPFFTQAPPFISGDNFQVQPKQLEGSGWGRAVGGFVVAPKLATITPSHRVIDLLIVTRDLALHSTGLSEALFEAALPTKSGQNRPGPWPAVHPGSMVDVLR